MEIMRSRLDEIVERWMARRDVAKSLGGLVDGARLCDELLRDLENLRRVSEGETLSLTAAAERSGYSREHLGRLVRAGRIPNAGRPNAPKIRIVDLPRKPGYLLRGACQDDITATSTRQIVRSIVTLSKRSSR
jgi:hypothetical protein